MSCLGWCTGVVAKLPQAIDGDDARLTDGVGVASLSSFLTSLESSTSSNRVRSSVEAQGARMPSGGKRSTQFSVQSVLSPRNQK